jgi:mRNA interferase MazF
MKRKFDVWLADLNPRLGTEPGKTRPVVIVQTDLLNNVHPSTMICPLTTQVVKGAEILRVDVRLKRLERPSQILVDQVRAIDNRRFIEKLGKLSPKQAQLLQENLTILLDL